MRRVLLALLVLGVFAPAAQAGGWATVGLDSTPTAARWDLNITVLQHGETPLAGVHPTVQIRAGTTTKTFPAHPTRRTGVYRASVTFPSAGTWSYVVYDGFVANQAHTFPAVTIGAARPAARASEDSRRWLLVPGVALLAVAGLLVLPRRRRAHQPQAA